MNITDGATRAMRELDETDMGALGCLEIRLKPLGVYQFMTGFTWLRLVVVNRQL